MAGSRRSPSAPNRERQRSRRQIRVQRRVRASRSPAEGSHGARVRDGARRGNTEYGAHP